MRYPNTTRKTDSMEPGDEIKKKKSTNGAMYRKVCGVFVYKSR